MTVLLTGHVSLGSLIEHGELIGVMLHPVPESLRIHTIYLVLWPEVIEIFFQYISFIICIAPTFSRLLITASWAGFFKALNLSTVSKEDFKNVQNIQQRIMWSRRFIELFLIF